MIWKQELDSIKNNKLYRELRSSNRYLSGLEYEGKQVIDFCSNDYFGMIHHPKVKQAAVNAIAQYGCGAGSSRLITGNHELYEKLEQQISQLRHTESSLVVGSGYLVNVGLISTLFDRHDLIVMDEKSHASSIDGCRLSRAKYLRFRHNDINHCTDILKEKRKLYKKCLIVVEHIYGMNGDIAPLQELMNIAMQYDALLAVDDAHGFGFIKMDIQPHIIIGTLSKGIGAYGGYIASSAIMIELLRNKMRTLIFSTGLPPATIASAYASLALIPLIDTTAILQSASNLAKSLNIQYNKSQILPIKFDSIDVALQAEQYLLSVGILAKTIRPPTVISPMIRISFSLQNHMHWKQLARALQQCSYIE